MLLFHKRVFLSEILTDFYARGVSIAWTVMLFVVFGPFLVFFAALKCKELSAHQRVHYAGALNFRVRAFSLLRYPTGWIWLAAQVLPDHVHFLDQIWHLVIVEYFVVKLLLSALHIVIYRAMFLFVEAGLEIFSNRLLSSDRKVLLDIVFDQQEMVLIVG